MSADRACGPLPEPEERPLRAHAFPAGGTTGWWEGRWRGRLSGDNQSLTHSPLSLYLETNEVMKEKHPEVIQRILFALGINSSGNNLVITWEDFLKMNSYLRYYSAPSKDYIKFWMLFFNP